MRLNRVIGMLSKLRINANFNILKTAYHSLFESYLPYDTKLWGQKNNETTTTFQKLQNRDLRKITFKKRHNRISCVYKECKLLKFPDILNLQNCVFMQQIQHSPKLSASFPALHVKDKHNYNTTSATHNLLDILLTKTNIYGKNSIKNHCIRDWNNLKKDLLDIADSELSLSKIKSYLKKNTSVNTELYHHYLPSFLHHNQYQQ